MMFSYGSGLASSMFSFRVSANIDAIRSRLNIPERLQQRIKLPPELYEEIMDGRKSYFNKPNYSPIVNLDHLSEGTYYLTGVDAKYRRTYARKGKSALLARNEVKNEELTTVKLEEKGLAQKEGSAVTRLKSVREQMKANEEAEINKKANDALLWTGFYKKTFKERLDHVFSCLIC